MKNSLSAKDLIEQVASGADAAETLDQTSLNESSLSRLWTHNEKHDCGAITAFRVAEDCGEGEKYTSSDNKKRNRSLMSKLKSKGYGLTQLKGTYPEGGKEAKEDSFFVVDLQETGDLLNDLKKLGAEFEQDSVLFVPKGAINGEGEKAFLLGTNNCPKGWPGMGKKDIFAGGKLGKTSKIYTSKVNGRPFMFESVLDKVYTPGSGYGWWSLHLAAAKHWSELEVDDD
jgi:hypothetical protein